MGRWLISSCIMLLLVFAVCVGRDRGKKDSRRSVSGAVTAHQVKSGQTVEAVVSALGEPSGRGGSGDDMMLFYPGGTLQFEKGQLVDYDEALTGAMLQRKPVVKPKPSQWLERIAIDSSDQMHKKYLIPGKITIVVFFAGWAGQGDDLRILRKEMSGVADVGLRAVDVRERNSPLVREFKLRSAPCCRVFDARGRKVGGDIFELGHAVSIRVQKARKGNRIFGSGGVNSMHRHLLIKGKVTVVYFAAYGVGGSFARHSAEVRQMAGRYDGVVVQHIPFKDCRDPKFRRYDLQRTPAVRVFNESGHMVGKTVVGI